MATRFAIATGNWSNTAIWDNGALPLSDDVVYPNGFTVTLDQDITVGSLNNNISNVYLPVMSIPLMTGNLTPSGEAFAGNNTSIAYRAFDYNASTNWNGLIGATGFVGYQFPVGKIIKRYYINKPADNSRPISWTFEGSNDGVTYTVLETVTSNTATTPYLSGILANTTSYTYYRLVMTATAIGGTGTSINSLEMTESVAAVYGAITGGTYTVPNTLSGTRNIVQTGAGIISNEATTVVSTNNTAGNTVNFNVSGVGLILNQLSQVTNANPTIINISGNGTVNFNSHIYGCQMTLANTTGGAIYINAGATVTVNGNIYLGVGRADGVGYYTIHLASTTSNSAVLNINGNVIANNQFVNAPIYLGSSGTINITGNLISDISTCILTPITDWHTGGAGFINLVGTAIMTNTNSQPCILTRTTLVTITGSVTNKGNTSAIWGNKIRWVNTGTPFWVFQDTTAADITLTYNTSIFNYPSTSDVRLGTTYASFPTLTGTCAIPLAQYVSQGVPVNATVGTAYFNASDVWNVLIADITVPGSIGERLKTASTVETTGDQIQAYQV